MAQPALRSLFVGFARKIKLSVMRIGGWLFTLFGGRTNFTKPGKIPELGIFPYKNKVIVLWTCKSNMIVTVKT